MAKLNGKLDCPIQGSLSRCFVRLDRHFERINGLMRLDPSCPTLLSEAKGRQVGGSPADVPGAPPADVPGASPGDSPGASSGSSESGSESGSEGHPCCGRSQRPTTPDPPCLRLYLQFLTGRQPSSKKWENSLQAVQHVRLFLGLMADASPGESFADNLAFLRDTERCQLWYSELLKSGWAPTTVHSYLTDVASFLRYLLEARLPSVCARKRHLKALLFLLNAFRRAGQRELILHRQKVAELGQQRLIPKGHLKQFDTRCNKLIPDLLHLAETGLMNVVPTLVGMICDPKESRAMPKSEAQEGPRIKAVYTLQESFDQEWCSSLKQVTELTCVKDEEVPRLECVPIKEEFLEQECVPIAEEVPTENNVCTLEENNQLGSSLCDDCPPECELGFRGSTSPPGSSIQNTDRGCREAVGHTRARRGRTLSNSAAPLSLQKGGTLSLPDQTQASIPAGRTSPPGSSIQNTAAKGNQTGRPPFFCADCGKRCTCLAKLKIHQRMHTGEKPHPCSECGKRFTELGNLKVHQRIHTGEKPYQCTECGRRFTKLGNLQSHLRIHTGEKPYQCTECGRSFTMLQNLKRHQRFHTGEKPYHCTECGRSSSNLSDFKKHMRIHTGEKPYRCAECGKSYTYLNSLKTHQQTHKKRNLLNVVNV